MIGGEDRNERLERAERHDEDGARLDQKRDIARDLAELFFERNGFDPPNADEIGLKPARRASPNSPAHTAFAMSRSLNFWILPVEVLGNSMKTTWRGHL